MQPKKTNKIKLNLVQFTDVNLRIETFDASVTTELETSTFELDCLYNEDESNKFGIRFQIELHSIEEEFSLNVIALAHFEADDILTEDFLKSDFTKVNAPAIAFPYVRTFISNLTLNAGYNPVFLPSFNFAALAEKKRKKSPVKKKVDIQDKSIT